MRRLQLGLLLAALPLVLARQQGSGTLTSTADGSIVGSNSPLFERYPSTFLRAQLVGYSFYQAAHAVYTKVTLTVEVTGPMSRRAMPLLLAAAPAGTAAATASASTAGSSPRRSRTTASPTPSATRSSAVRPSRTTRSPRRSSRTAPNGGVRGPGNSLRVRKTCGSP